MVKAIIGIPLVLISVILVVISLPIAIITGLGSFLMSLINDTTGAIAYYMKGEEDENSY